MYPCENRGSKENNEQIIKSSVDNNEGFVCLGHSTEIETVYDIENLIAYEKNLQ